MRCNFCGTDVPDGTVYCPSCGNLLPQTPPPSYDPNAAQATYSQPVSEHPVHSFFLPMLRNPLYMVIAILCTVSAALTLLAGGGINLFALLFAIFTWMTYVKAKDGVVDRNSLRRVSGTAYALYVVNMVVGILEIVSGLLFTLSFSFVKQEFVDLFLSELQALDVPTEMLELITGAGIVAFGILCGAIVTAIGVVTLLMSVLGYRRLHRFAQSLYQSLDVLQFRFENPFPVRNWLIALGVLSAASAVNSSFDFLSFIAAGSSAAAYIVAAVLVKKYFITPQPQQ